MTMSPLEINQINRRRFQQQLLDPRPWRAFGRRPRARKHRPS